MGSFTIELNDLEAPVLSAERATVPPYEGWEWTFAPEDEPPGGPVAPQEGS